MKVADIRGMTQTFVHCEVCGAIVGVKVNGEFATDGSELHIQWHQALMKFSGGEL